MIKLNEEWSNIFKHKFLLIIIIFVALIPAIYSNVFLGSLWNPYQSIDNLPVAVVNYDEGAKIEGKDVNIGKELIDRFKENKTLKFSFIDDETNAIDDLNSGKYYMVLKIDKNFSKNASSLLNKAPLKMDLEYTVNPGLNFISTKITDSAMKDIQKELVKTVQRTYIKLLFDNMDKLRDGYVDVTEGTKLLSNGVGKLYEGQKEMSEGVNKLDSGSKQLKSGSDKLYNGMLDYSSSIEKLANGLYDINSNSGKLLQGFNTFSDKISHGSSKILGGTEKLEDALKKVDNSLPSYEDINKLNNGILGIKDGSEKLNTGLAEYISYLEKYQSSIEKINQGHIKLLDSMQHLDENTQKFVDKITELFPDAKKPFVRKKVIEAINDMRLNELKNSINTLKNGTDEIVEAGNKLVGKPENSSGIYGIKNGVENLETAMNKLSDSQIKANNGYNSLREGLEADNGMLKGIAELKNGIENLNSGINSGLSNINNGLNQYVNGVERAEIGAGKLNEYTGKLVSGAYDLNNSLNLFNDYMGKLKSGSLNLLEGNEKLKSESENMYSKLSAATDKLVDYSFDDDNAKMLTDPLKINREETSVIINNGHAMAPYMMTISLFIGAIGICMVFPFNRGKEECKNIIKWWGSKLSVMVVEALLQAGILVVSLKLFLGFSPIYMSSVFIVAFMASMAFLSIASFFILNFGSIGKFLTIIVLVLQLATSEGTYPLVLSNVGYKRMSPYMPATYAIRGLKEGVSINGAIGKYVLVLLGFIVVFNILSLIVISVQKNKNLYIKV